LKELRCQQQNQQAGEQGKPVARAKGDIAQQPETDVDGDDSNGDGGKKLEYRRRQKGHLQGFHGDTPVLIRALIQDIAGLGGLAEQLQGRQAPNLVQKLPGQPADGLEVLLVNFLCTHTHKGHEQRDQRRRQQQKDTGQPVEPENQCQNHQRDNGRQDHLGQEPGKITVQGFHVVEPFPGQGSGRGLRQSYGAGSLPVIMQLAAGMPAHLLTATGGKPGLQALKQSPDYQRTKQQKKPGGKSCYRLTGNYALIDQPGQQHHLGDRGQPGQCAGYNRGLNPAPAGPGKPGQPAFDVRLSRIGHSVIAFAGTYLAAEYPVGPGRVGEHNGNHEQQAEQQEQL